MELIISGDEGDKALFEPKDENKPNLNEVDTSEKVVYSTFIYKYHVRNLQPNLIGKKNVFKSDCYQICILF